jgi:hypothetical protein
MACWDQIVRKIRGDICVGCLGQGEDAVVYILVEEVTSRIVGSVRQLTETVPPGLRGCEVPAFFRSEHLCAFGNLELR